MPRIGVSLLLGLALGVSPAAQPAPDLPPARQVIDRFVSAIGGENAVRKYKTRRAVGTFSIPSQGLEGTLEVLAAAPDRQRVSITVSGLGSVLQGFDGQIAWSIDPMTGPRLLEGAERSQMQIDADFYSELHDARHYKSLETVERTIFEGTPALKIRLLRPSGEEDFEYFAADSGLLVGSQLTRITPMGPMPATTVLSDYKDFGGIKIATRVVQKIVGLEQVMRITQVEHDTLDESAFAPPASIKALVK